ncbi:MAG: glycosyltransferase [Flavobacteriales bacterium]|nr:glycosyltransferase [Flavobacteriales bacterium]
MPTDNYYLREVNYYLNRFSVREQLINEKSNNDLGIIVVIPCCNEPDLISSLKSLVDCEQPTCSAEVIIVVNASENAEESVLNQNKRTINDAVEWGSKYQDNHVTFYFIEENNLSKKHAGVGLARKIGMDEAVRRFDAVNNHQGIIACFDADALCEPSYLVELEKHFKKHPKSPACSIHFEHPIEGNEFSSAIYNGITQYELHLRYYKNGLAYAGLPYAFHTIGSSMAVRSEAYQKQNGMNKRKAGEDFYFLQKLIPLGNFTEMKTTKIIPSPRVSNRVPFGTGKAMQSWLDDEKQELMSYNPKSFIDLKMFCEAVPELYNDKNVIPKTIQAFLDTIDFEENLANIKKNSKSQQHFVEIFFKWFNAFKVLKYMHFVRDNYYPDVSIFEGANELLTILDQQNEKNVKKLLIKYRLIDTV